MSQDNIYLLGGTGNIGSPIVKGLIAAGVRATVYSRDTTKAQQLFAKETKTGLLHFVEGTFDNSEAFAKSIGGHTRLFLVVTELNHLGSIKGEWGKIAYESGVKQIVDISSFTVEFSKNGVISYQHTRGEEKLLEVVGDNSLVILRPGYFMTNHILYDIHSIKNLNQIIGSAPPTHHLSMVDPADIADVALNVFLDPIEKHGVVVYSVHPEVMTNLERVQILSKVLGREITYVQDSFTNFYNRMVGYGLPHKMVYDLISVGLRDFQQPTPQITILTKKPIRTFEQWVTENKDKLS